MLVPVPSTEAREYAHLLVEIDIRKRRIAELEAERSRLEAALTRFAVELRNRVGGLRGELNRVRLQAAEYRRRAERLRENEYLDPASVEEEVAREFADRRDQTAGDPQADSGHRIESPRVRPTLDAETEAEILRLYRELAKRFHPDLARNDAERKRRSDLMLRINVAFSERDLLTLQTVAREAETGEPTAALLTDHERVVWARRVIQRLEEQIAHLHEQLAALRGSETFQLWQSPDDSDQSLINLETRVRQRLIRERDRLDEAIIDYNRIARRRRMHPHFPPEHAASHASAAGK